MRFKIIFINLVFVLCLGMSWVDRLSANQGSSNAEENILILKNFIGKTYSEMVAIFGAPVDKSGYAIKDAPTKSWNHAELFAQYPKTKENADIQIMEVTWEEGEFFIFANFHMVNGENRCFIIKKIKKDVRF